MGVSRRGFFDLLAAGAGHDRVRAMITARGHEDGQGGPASDAAIGDVRIGSNENPLGPGQAVLDVMMAQFGEASRYPFNDPNATDGHLTDAIASARQVAPDRVVLAVGSGELLRNAVRAFCSPFRHLVTAAPTFETCTTVAKQMKIPFVAAKVDAQLRLDLESMLAQVRGAGLVYVNNPNNPTATVHGAAVITDFVERVRRVSPDTVVLIDEAYHDYVTDPAYRTAIPLALATPNVLVTRTFSKAYGMAGLRVGYGVGQPDTIKPLARIRMPYSISVFSAAAAVAALGDQAHLDIERARNTAVREFTLQALTAMGAKPSASQANFVFADIGRPAAGFRAACQKQRVFVGRDFPPFEASHTRISLGTMDEMRRAVGVFRDALRLNAPAAGGKERRS